MNKAPKSKKTLPGIFSGGGEMGRLMRAFDWEKTPLGPVGSWPQALRVAIRILLGSGYSMYIGWGEEFIQFYNDAYFPILGNKHPVALGKGTPETFSEIWDFIGPMFRRVMVEAEATTLFDQILYLERNGYPEECYFTFSYSPIPSDELGHTGGVFVTALETTDKVIEERRLTLLRDLATDTCEARDEQQVLRLSAAILQNDLHDMPFSLLYTYDTKTRRAVLAGAAGIPTGHALAPESLEEGPTCIWPVHEALSTGRLTRVTDLSRLSTSLPTGPWSVPPQDAVIFPIRIPAQESPYGFLVAALNPHKTLEPKYEAFLERAAQQISRNVADAHAYQEERKRVEELAALDRAKTAFFSNVSHEFRTPLTLMLGPLEDILSRGEGRIPAEDHQQLVIAHRNSLRLLKLVNTLLDFSRLEAGRIQAAYQPTDLAALTADLAGVFRSAMERGGLRYHVHCRHVELPIYVDRDMWEKIVLNLLSNAFKFTLQGDVWLTLAPVEGGAELTVSDTGIGIPESELPRIFERFHRIEGAQGRTYEGTGIGLALVNELVKLHQGLVQVESTYGAGSKLKVFIPAGKDHLPQEHVGAARNMTSTAARAETFVEEALRWLPQKPGPVPMHAHQSLPDIAPDPFEALAPSAKKALIVLADDNADVREYLTRVLGNIYEVHAVPDGLQALAAVRKLDPKLVLTDAMMPHLDGFGLLRALREDQATEAIPVIILSARAGEESRIEGLHSGADDYIVKPFTARELIARVGALISMARLRQTATEREKELRAEAELERQRLQDLFVQVPAGIALIRGPEHRWVFANPFYMKIVGRGPSQFLGKTVAETLPEIREQGFIRILDDVYSTGRPYLGTEMAVKLERNKPGELEVGYFNFIFQPILDVAKQVEGILIHAVEVTEQVLARQAVEKSEASLRFAQQAANIGSWELNLVSDEFRWSEEASRMLGRPGISTTARTKFLNSMYYSGDREYFTNALDRTLKKKAPFQVEFRVVRDDSVSLLSARGTMFYNQGNPLLIGFFVDIGNASPGNDLKVEKGRGKKKAARAGKGKSRKAKKPVVS